MDIEQFRKYCLSKKGVTEEFPFDHSTLVFKVMGKMFALVNVDSLESMNIKCEPEKAIELREQFPDIIPGYHMDKRHWNTVKFNAGVSDQLALSLVDNSYELVAKGLSKPQKQVLKEL